MPMFKSFDDNELVTNPGQKFKLTCSAFCEPVCGLRWYIGQKPLELHKKTSGDDLSKISMIDSSDDGIDFVRFNELVAHMPTINSDMSQKLSFDDIKLIQSQHHSSPLNLIRYEMISKPSLATTNNSAYWFYASITKPKFRQQDHSQPEVASAKADLKSMLHLEQQKSGAKSANVISTLELNHNQLHNLLTRVDPLKISCGIVAPLDWPFKYELVGFQGEWFPSSGPLQVSIPMDAYAVGSPTDSKRFGEMETSVFLNRK